MLSAAELALHLQRFCPVASSKIVSWRCLLYPPPSLSQGCKNRNNAVTSTIFCSRCSWADGSFNVGLRIARLCSVFVSPCLSPSPPRPLFHTNASHSPCCNRPCYFILLVPWFYFTPFIRLLMCLGPRLGSRGEQPQQMREMCRSQAELKTRLKVPQVGVCPAEQLDS
jgi:hypothetical protein